VGFGVLVCRSRFLGCDGMYPPWFAEVCIRSLFICSPPPFSSWFLVCNRFQLFSLKTFFTKAFCGSLGINLSMGRNTDRGKVAYSWISQDPAKAGPTLGIVVVVVVCSRFDLQFNFDCATYK